MAAPGEAQTQPAPSAASAAVATSMVDLVNLLQGTQSTPVFSHGNTLPIAAMPFGMAHWTLQTNANTPWMFQPWARRIQGFRCTHQLSPWLYDYRQATFMPFRGKIGAEPSARASSYIPDDAKLTPYALQLFLLRYRATVELVPTERCCLLAADFEAPDPADPEQLVGLVIDIPATTLPVTPLKETRTIRFTSTATSGGTPPGFATYYVIKFAEDWDNFEIQHHKDFHTGVYGYEIHEMSEMAAVPFGQYAQSNQPSHHLLYIFAHAGRADRTQFWARRTMAELYSPDSFPGDEDTGSMAAWYILSSLGIYQVCPGLPEYTFGSPLFPGATVHLPGGKTLAIHARNNSPENVYVRSVSWNGKTQTGPTIQHAELVAGGTLAFEMTSSL